MKLQSDESIPKIFTGWIEYQDNPDALEKAQRTFNEEGLYRVIETFAKQWYQSIKRPAHILDLCSATGLAALQITHAIPVSSVTLVDLDKIALEKGLNRFKTQFPGLPVFTHCEDAVTFDNTKKYDLILMNSAYHHIEDNRKIDFLKNATGLLNRDGAILMGEHFLSPYRNVDEYRQSIIEFYTALIYELEKRNESADAINVIRRSGLYGWLGQYEYKISMEIFLQHLKYAEIKILKKYKVWSFKYENEKIISLKIKNNTGTFSIILIKV